MNNCRIFAGLPKFHNFICKQFTVENVLLVIFECKEGGLPSVDAIAPDVANGILSAAGSTRIYHELRSIPVLREYFSREKLLFIADLSNGGFEWDLAARFIVDWLNDIALPHAVSLNRQRIFRAIPVPPQYSPQEIFPALWVLECASTMSQGTAFSLDDIGIVTCEHVVSGTKELCAFHPSAPLRNLRFGL